MRRSWHACRERGGERGRYLCVVTHLTFDGEWNIATDGDCTRAVLWYCGTVLENRDHHGKHFIHSLAVRNTSPLPSPLLSSLWLSV